jgi:uncharacterized protein (DUF58 family)
VHLTLGNVGDAALFGVRLEDHFTADREGPHVIHLPARVDPGTPVGAPYAAACSKRRGNYAIGPLVVTWEDPLGIFPGRWEHAEPNPLTVVPRITQIQDLSLEGRPRWDALGLRTTRRSGSSLTFFGTREYRQGDSLRYIHWPSTARTGELIVKEFELDIAAEVAIFLDLHYRTLKGFGRETTLEYAVRIAASVAHRAIEQACQVQLIAHAAQPLHVASCSGQVHLLTILNALSSVQASGKLPFDALLLRAQDLLGPGATAVLLFNSSHIDLGRYINAIWAYRAKGVRIVAVLIDDNTFLNLSEGIGEKRVQADLIPDVVRLLLTQGVTVYTIGQGQDLADRFQRPYVP